MRARRAALALGGLLGAALLAAPLASAHFGGLGSTQARFRVPEWSVWVTGGLVVAFSFVVLGAYALWRTAPSGGVPPPARPPADPRRGPLRAFARALGVLLLALVVANAFTGGLGLVPDAAVWLGAWSALPIVAYAVGNPWPWVSPFRALAPLADWLRGGRAPLRYPARLGAWPSVPMVLALTALEVGSGGPGDAGGLGLLALGYAAFTFLGMFAFGSAAWLARVEVFDRVFAWWGAAAPWERSGGRWRFRGFAEGLRHLPSLDASDAAFTVALLFGVNFDGFLATPPGAAALRTLGALGAGGARLAMLGLGFGLFLAAFVVCAVYVRRWSESLEPLGKMAARVAPALVPIAVGYHLAHNLFYVWEQAPRLAAAALDPLGTGPLLRAALPATLPLPAWLAPAVGSAQLFFILAGHVLAVMVAHDLAFAAYPSRVQAVRSEGPLTVAMVFYTLVGLWIVSAAAGPAVPQTIAVVAAGAVAAPAVLAREAGAGVYACDRCGLAYARRAYLALHVGRAHALRPEERASFDAAVREEEAWLRGFQRHMRGGLATLPCVVFLLLSLFLLDALGVGFGLAVLIFPGMTAFGGLLYYFAWSSDPPAPPANP